MWDTKADWDASYAFGAEPEGHPNTRPQIRLNYHRSVMLPLAKLRAGKLAKAFNWVPPGPSILFVGAAFGWTPEVLESWGFDRVIATDISPYVQAHQDGTEEADIDEAIRLAGLSPSVGEGLEKKRHLFDGQPRTRLSGGILNLDINVKRSRETIGPVDVVVTESVLEDMSFKDASLLDKSCRELSSNVVHYITTRPPRRALTQWRKLLPHSRFIEAI